MNSVGTRNSAEPMTIYSMHPMTSCGGEGGGGGGVWGEVFWILLFPMYSHQILIFSPKSSSQWVLNMFSKLSKCSPTWLQQHLTLSHMVLPNNLSSWIQQAGYWDSYVYMFGVNTSMVWEPPNIENCFVMGQSKILIAKKSFWTKLRKAPSTN